MDVVPVNLENHDPLYSRSLCQELERGNILLLAETPFSPPEEDLAFLRMQRQAERRSHKNIAYKPNLQRISGAYAAEPEDAERMRRILAAYSEGALKTLNRLFVDYSKAWRVDYASYRPLEEAGRVLPISRRNDLLHLDAFPTRPTNGGRILRAFTNIHPSDDRVWATSDPFDALAETYAAAAGLGRVTGPIAFARRSAAGAARRIGLPVPHRSAYDDFMLGFHHYLKRNTGFQATGRKKSCAFGPGSTWISFTDQIAHAVMSGRYALEQTCIVPFSAMVEPERAPLRVLERLAGRSLAEANGAN